MDRAGACSFYEEDMEPTRTIAWLVSSNSDWLFAWEQVDPALRDFAYQKHMDKVNKWLDDAERVIRGYCAKYGLGEPIIHRDIKSRVKRTKELDRFIDEHCLAGDHLVILHTPYLSDDNQLSMMRTMARIKKLASRKIVLHMVAMDTDFSSPLAGMFLHHGYQISTYARPAMYDDFGDEVVKGHIQSVGGMRYERARNHLLFNWIVSMIRDKGYSIKELASYAGKYWRVVAVAKGGRKSVPIVLAITKSRETARALAGKDTKVCEHCMNSTDDPFCGLCSRRTSRIKMLVASRGLIYNFFRGSDRYSTILADIMRTWELYCNNNQAQDRKPWAKRIRKKDVDRK
jgi:hypothetical protein